MQISKYTVLRNSKWEMKAFFFYVICITLFTYFTYECVSGYATIMNPEVSKNNFCTGLTDVNSLDLTVFPIFNDDNVQRNRYKSEKPDSLDLQALTAVKFALKLIANNNSKKAEKLFQHALTSSPNHPEVLLHYGEFLESSKDFINADTIYWKALILGGPENSRTLANHKRLLPVVNKLDQAELKKIDHKRSELDHLNNEDFIIKALRKELYFQCIYHSVAIEGNTMSLEEIRAFIENGKTATGKSESEHNEIIGMETALSYVEQTLTFKKDINVTDILEIHKRILGLIQPSAAGIFRKSQVYVGGYRPPAASDVEGLVEELIVQLQSSRVKNMHPVQIAAFAHHKLAFIHPFLDGNGRTSRLLMNLIFEKYRYPPVIIRKEERTLYFNVLRIASKGDPRPFYRFIAGCAENVIDEFLHAHKFKEFRLHEISIDDGTGRIPLPC